MQLLTLFLIRANSVILSSDILETLGHFALRWFNIPTKFNQNPDGISVLLNLTNCKIGDPLCSISFITPTYDFER